MDSAMIESIIENTDFLMVIATILSAIIMAGATIFAVILSNRETRKQLIEQQEKHAQELVDADKRMKYVKIKPMLLYTTFGSILELLIIRNDYNRELVFSGEDGFDFYDDERKRFNQVCRILHIENPSNYDIKDVEIIVNSILENKNSNEKRPYSAKNGVKLIRSKESIDIRLTDQIQYESILDMKNKKNPNDLTVDCIVRYSTEGDQRIEYSYQLIISNDERIEIKKDENHLIDFIDNIEMETTPYRNLQDYLSGIDRSAYVWQKMAQSQVMGVFGAISKKSETNFSQDQNANQSPSNGSRITDNMEAI